METDTTPSTSSTPLTIGKLARAADVPIDTIRYYERRGLVEAAERTDAGYRLFDPAAVDQLRFIKKAQGLGFSLEEARLFLRYGSSESADVGEVRALALDKIAQLQAQVDEIEEMKAVLQRLARECAGAGPVDECPILEYFHDEHDGGETHD